jgi:hypothetical protein
VRGYRGGRVETVRGYRKGNVKTVMGNRGGQGRSVKWQTGVQGRSLRGMGDQSAIRIHWSVSLSIFQRMYDAYFVEKNEGEVVPLDHKTAE